uniref:Uncharacterized protein n=1 Tax=Arundo donax TaxID=35708 RepID=A0A0A9D7N8_ARUDO
MRAVQFSKAGLHVPEELSLFKRSGERKVSENSDAQEQDCPAKFVEPAKSEDPGREHKNINNMKNGSVKAVECQPVMDVGDKEPGQGEATVQECINPPIVVPVSRPHEVEKARRDLPIVMMEQEIMEAIYENSVWRNGLW